MYANGQCNEHLPPGEEEHIASHLQEIAGVLGDSPETVIAQQFIREGAVEILCAGNPVDLEGAIVQIHAFPEEPIAFGSSAAAVASLLPHLSGWTCINVPMSIADDLVAPVAESAEADSVRLLDDIHFTQERPSAAALAGDARLLTVDDMRLIQQAPDIISGVGMDRVIDRLSTGHVAGVVRDNALISIALTFATSDRYADIGVATHPDWRNRGFGMNVAAKVTDAVHRDGRTPVWSCGGTNFPSLAIARRLGFVEILRRIYLIPEWDDATPRPDHHR